MLRGAWGTFSLAALLGLSVGGAAAFSPAFAAGLAVVGLAVLAVARSSVRTEIVVGLFWFALALYETLFADVTIAGFFYPFYLAFLASILVGLLRDGLRVDVPLLLSYAAFLLVVMVSFIGFSDAITFDVVQRLVAYLLGGLVLLQFRSRRGLWPVLTAATAAAVVIAGWVIVSSVQGGFTYRGDVDVDQNVVSFYVGFGVIIASCLGLHVVGRRERRWALLPLALVLGVTIYGSLLLASRGMTLALVLAMGAVVVDAVRRSPRALLFVAVLGALGVGAMFLPGGQGLLERFGGERIETGGSRIPVWEATLEAYADGGLRELVLGHGWGSSREFVERSFGWIASTHNTYVQMIYEFGLVGLAAFVWLHAHLVLRAWRLPSPYGPIAAGTTWFLVGAHFSTNPPDGFLFWVALALALAIGSRVEAEPRAAKAPRPTTGAAPERGAATS